MGSLAKERLSDLPEVMQAAYYGAGNSTRTPKQQTNPPTPGLSVPVARIFKALKRLYPDFRDGSGVIESSLTKITE